MRARIEAISAEQSAKKTREVTSTAFRDPSWRATGRVEDQEIEEGELQEEKPAIPSHLGCGKREHLDPYLCPRKT